jgi:hypothetical protein
MCQQRAKAQGTEVPHHKVGPSLETTDIDCTFLYNVENLRVQPDNTPDIQFPSTAESIMQRVILISVFLHLHEGSSIDF